MRSINEITPEWLMENKIVYFGHPTDERLSAESLQGYIDRFIDDCEVDRLPATMEVTAFRLIRISILGWEILDRVLEDLDEKHGDPDGEACDPTPEMRLRADALAKTITEEYTPGRCEHVETFTVDLVAWCARMKKQCTE